MTETELLRLPEIPEGPPAEQLKAVKRYLCRLAEQLEYILTNERRERLREQDPLQTSLTQWEKYCFSMLDLAKRRGW